MKKKVIKKHFCPPKIIGKRILLHYLWLLGMWMLLGLQSQAVGQTTHVTLDVKDSPLREVFKLIREQTGMRFLYSEVEIQKASLVTVKFEKLSLQEALDHIFAGQPYVYEIQGPIVIVEPAPQHLSDKKKRTLKGRVTDEKGLPLPGANIMVKGTLIGVPSDVDGYYSLTFDAKYTVLQISFVGYKTIEKKVGKEESIDFQLFPDKEEMDEVLVTGYQTISQERSTGAFDKISGKTLEMKRMSNLSSLLNGEVAGYSDGIIRGYSTMNAQKTPLYVIDGFPIENTSLDSHGSATESLPFLNLEDIESITVLKDAAAASIYGARAANGVIVITTKKAKKGKTQIQASGVVTVRPYYYYTGNLTNSADIIELEKLWASSNSELTGSLESAVAEAENRRNNYTPPSAGVDILLDLYTRQISQVAASEQLNQLASCGYRYYDDVKKYAKRNSLYQQYYLNVGKATERNNFSLSATYRNNKEEDLYTQDDQVGFNMQNALQVTSWLSAEANMYLHFKNSTLQTYDLLNYVNSGYEISPYMSLKNEDGTNATFAPMYDKTVRDNIENYGLYDISITPLDELDKRLTKTRDFTSRISAKLDVKLAPWLTYDVMYQYEYSNSRSKRLEELESYATRVTLNRFATYENGEVVYNLPEGDIFYQENHFSNAYNFRQQLNIDKTFKDVHSLRWILGHEVRHTKIEYDHLYRYGYDSDLMTSQNINEGLLAGGISGLMNEYTTLSRMSIWTEMVNRFVSYYSNVAYTYDRRYTLSGSIRWDRSNLWGTNSKYQNKPLWSVGAAWNISSEKFFDCKWADMLKLRLSYGIGGNIAKGSAPYLTATYFTSNLVGGLYGSISTPPNPNLRWEKTTTFNIGADFALFSNRLLGTLDFYNKLSEDLLANQTGIPTEGFGYSTLVSNNGVMRNRGIELSLSGDVIRREHLNWNMGFIFAYNKNKVLEVDVTAPLYYMQMYMPEAYPRKGDSYNALYLYKWAGLSEEGEPQIYDKDGKVTTTDYTDIEAIHYAGTSVPLYNGSFTNMLTYRNFDLSVQVLYAGGHKIRNSNIPDISMDYPVRVTNKDIRKRWRKVGDEATTDVPRVLFSDSPDYNYWRESIYEYADIHALDASYIKINNVSLNYNLPEKWVKKSGLSGVRLQFNIENLVTFAFDKKAGYLIGAKEKPNYVGGLYIHF